MKRRAVLVLGLLSGVIESVYGQKYIATLSPTKKAEICNPEPPIETPQSYLIVNGQQKDPDGTCYKYDYEHQKVWLNLDGLNFEVEFSGEKISMTGREMFEIIKG